MIAKGESEESVAVQYFVEVVVRDDGDQHDINDESSVVFLPLCPLSPSTPPFFSLLDTAALAATQISVFFCNLSLCLFHFKMG